MSVRLSRSGVDLDVTAPIFEATRSRTARPDTARRPDRGDRRGHGSVPDFRHNWDSSCSWASSGPPRRAAAGQLSLSYIVVLSLADAALVLLLVWLLLRAHDERPLATFAGSRPTGREALLGPGARAGGAAHRHCRFRHHVTCRSLAAQRTGEPARGVDPNARRRRLVRGGRRGGRQSAGGGATRPSFSAASSGISVAASPGSSSSALRSVWGHLVQGRDAAVVTGLLGSFWGNRVS